MLRLRVPLIRRFLEPFHGFNVVFRNSTSLCVEKSHSALRPRKALICSLLRPLHGFVLVFCDANALRIAEAQTELSFSLSFFSLNAPRQCSLPPPRTYVKRKFLL